MISQKVQIDKGDVAFINQALELLSYGSKSEYIRIAVKEKIRIDRRKLREAMRQKAMQGYCHPDSDNVFEAIEGDDFADR